MPEKVKMTNATHNLVWTTFRSSRNEQEHEHKIEDWDQVPNIIGRSLIRRPYSVSPKYGVARSVTRLSERAGESPSQSIQQRLDNANRHFKRKSAEVLADEDAVCLLADMYESINIVFDDFDACEHGVALARLAAANFCEIGARGIYITEAGQRFIEALNRE